MRAAHRLRNLSIFLAILSLIYSISPSSAANDLKDDYDQLFLFVTIISVIVSVGVIGLWIYFMKRFSESNTETERKPLSHETSRKLEVTWTLVAIGIIILLMIVSYPVLFDLDNSNANLKDSKEIFVEASEYQWKFTYYNLSGDLITERSLELKAGLNYKFTVTSSADFIHSFFVPDLNIKIDAIPGVNNSITVHLSKTGSFDIVCAEYCGFGHSFMRPGAEGSRPGEYIITIVP